MANAVWVYDFTTPADKADKDDIINCLNEHTKKWTFQLERGETTGYEHYQGRFSLKVKRRPNECIKLFKDMPLYNIRPTSTANHENDFYVTKADTRIDGPWKDTDKVTFIPRQYRDLDLYPWQQTIKDSAEHFEPRIINLIYDPAGGRGKSTIAAICELLHGGIDMPPLNDYKELIALACNICMDANLRSPKIMFFDMPRAVRKDQLFGLYSAIEQIKKGKLYDCRYHYKSWWIDSPQIWVFTNTLPDTSLLSMDRWRLWQIDANALTPFALPPAGGADDFGAYDMPERR